MTRPQTIFLAVLVLLAIPAGASEQPRNADFLLPVPDEYRTRGLPPYAEMVLKLDGNALLPSPSKLPPRLGEVLVNERPKFDVLWWDQNNMLVYQTREQPFDFESLSLVGEAPRIAVGVYHVQVRLYHPDHYSKPKPDFESSALKRVARLITEPVDSKPVEIQIAAGYAVSVTPATAEPGQPVQVSLSAAPSRTVMSHAKVLFGGTDAPVVERGTYSLTVDVPNNLSAGLRPEIRVTLRGSDGATLSSEPFADFTVAAAKDGSFM
jgi:hypothetical protein